jgi:hypothetical protein
MQGIKIRRATIVGAGGTEDVSIPSNATKDFRHRNCRYIIDPKAIKMKSLKILSVIDFLFMGAMFCLLGAAGAPQFYVAGVSMFMVGFMIKGAEQFFKVPFLLYFEGRPLPVTFASDEAYKLPQIVRDGKGNIKEVKMIDGYNFDSVIEGHALRDLGWKPFQNIPWKWIIIGVVGLIIKWVIVSAVTAPSPYVPPTA